jgi:polyisoprenoid-binding protein YceI
MPIDLRCGIVAVLLLLGAAPCCAAEQFAVDPVHTRIAFRVGHAGFSHALGTFRGASGTLTFDDAGDPAKLDLTLPVATLDLGDDDWNGKVLDGTFFDAKKLPTASFVSTSVAFDAADHRNLHVKGELTIHGVMQPVEFDARFNALKRHPLTFKRTAGFSAVLHVSRKAFGMGAWSGVIDDDVEILVELEATKAKGGGDDSSPAQPAPESAPPAEEETPTPEPETVEGKSS